MSELSCTIERILTNISDKQGSKVADLVKYVHLQEGGTVQIIISEAKS